MPTPRIYVNDVLSEDCLVTLDKKSSNHLYQVLRLKVQSPVILFNGQGGEFYGILKSIHQKQSTVYLTKHISIERESYLDITLIQAISRHERMEYTLQKATELGVQRIMPVMSQRCVVQLKGERKQSRYLRWQQIIQGACQQSGRNKIPQLLAVDSLQDCLEKYQFNSGLLLHPEADSLLSQFTLRQGVPMALLIGPEGGLTNHEMTFALQQGFTAIRLGNRILRTETAALAAISALQVMGGDF